MDLGTRSGNLGLDPLFGGDALDGRLAKLRLPGYPSRDLYAFLAFLAFVVVRYIQIGARRDFLATIRFEFLVGMLVIVLVTMQFGTRPPNLDRSKPMLVMIGLLFLAMIAQLPFAAAPVIAKTIFNDRVVKFAFLTYFMAVMIESPKQLRWFLITFLFSIFYITLESVEGLISGGLVWQSQGIMRLHGAVPIYMHPNSLAGVAMGSLPFVTFLFVHHKSRIIKLGFLATAVTSIICVIYSGSRTGYIGFIVFILWWWFQSDHKLKFLRWLLVLGTVFVLIIPDQYIERFESIGGEEAEGGSKIARIQIMKDAYDIFLDNPMGVGVASFPAVRMARFGRLQDTHNLYLEVATNLGIQGLAIFLILVYVMLMSFRSSMISFRRQQKIIAAMPGIRTLPKASKSTVQKHYQDLGYLVATCKAAGGFVIVRLALGFFGMDLYEVYWWFGAGLAMALSGISIYSRRITRRFADTYGAASIPGDTAQR